VQDVLKSKKDLAVEPHLKVDGDDEIDMFKNAVNEME
jgi:hypothetical protein